MPKKNTTENKPTRKEIAETKTKMSDVEGIDGTFIKCARSNTTGDIAMNFELNGFNVRCTINPNTEKVRGRVYPIPSNPTV